MAIKLPPPPIYDNQSGFGWIDWNRQVRDFLKDQVTTVSWSNIDFTGSNITDILTKEHNALQSTQGGTAGEKYHLTLAQWTALTSAVIRENVSSNRTYYVRTDGSDSNTGLTNTAGGAFLTIQKAVDVISSTLDIASGVTITIQIADGTYSTGANLKLITGPGGVIIRGNSTTPSNVLISCANGPCFSANNVSRWTILDLKVSTTSSSWCIHCTNGATIVIGNLDFGSAVHAHIVCDERGSVTISSNYVISGSAVAHVYLDRLSNFSCNTKTITITGTPNFSTAFILTANVSSTFFPGCTFSGSATGKRYDIYMNGVVYVNGAGTTYFPGSVAGTTATGGQYA